jgi:hypothetical protein
MMEPCLVRIMAKNRKPKQDPNATAKETVARNFEETVDQAVEDTIEQTIELTMEQPVEEPKKQVLGMVDSYFNILQSAISSYPSGGTVLGEKMKSYGKKNLAATQEYMRKLSQTTDFQEIFRIQTEFVKVQMNELKNISAASAKVFYDAIKTTTPVNRSS